ncbi:MAG: ZIP family metal transporter [Bacilli bacterium]|jgi:ZIP family zinc transporter|nr:ZIP family metal transporter [Bacilli bacterium]
MDLSHNFILFVIVACLLTWGFTALGSATVFLFKNINNKVMDAMLGFAAGVMIAASFFSLIIPGLEFARLYNPNIHEMIIVAVGFICGSFFLLILNNVTPHIHLFEDTPEGPKSHLKRSMLLFLAITIHNIPEGLAVGVVLGAFNLLGASDPALFSSALALIIGIAIQNFPEGAAISFPLHREGFSKFKSFMFGQASAIVEPIGIIAGILLINIVKPILPFALAFAAGAMIFVVIEELIPESQKGHNTNISTIFTIFGLVLMMILDNVLG